MTPDPPHAPSHAPSHAAAHAPLTGVILAGGRGRRFGGHPKGLASVGGTRILDRVADALAATTDALLLIAHAPDADRWLPGVHVAGDVHPGCGALGGLHAALTHAAGDVLVLAWDMPFVPPSLLAELRDVGRAGAPAVLPLHPDGHPEPLCAWYGAPCRALAGALLARGERRAGALADAAGAVRLTPAEVARHGDPRTLLLSVNTPEDLAHAATLVDAGAPRPP